MQTDFCVTFVEVMKSSVSFLPWCVSEAEDRLEPEPDLWGRLGWLSFNYASSNTFVLPSWSQQSHHGERLKGDSTQSLPAECKALTHIRFNVLFAHSWKMFTPLLQNDPSLNDSWAEYVKHTTSVWCSCWRWAASWLHVYLLMCSLLL